MWLEFQIAAWACPAFFEFPLVRRTVVLQSRGSFPSVPCLASHPHQCLWCTSSEWGGVNSFTLSCMRLSHCDFVPCQVGANKIQCNCDLARGRKHFNIRSVSHKLTLCATMRSVNSLLCPCHHVCLLPLQSPALWRPCLLR